MYCIVHNYSPMQSCYLAADVRLMVSRFYWLTLTRFHRETTGYGHFQLHMLMVKLELFIILLGHNMYPQVQITLQKATKSSFAALRQDGRVITWGDPWRIIGELPGSCGDVLAIMAFMAECCWSTCIVLDLPKETQPFWGLGSNKAGLKTCSFQMHPNALFAKF